MKKLIFEYTSYRNYLKYELERLGPRSGLKRRASIALNVHTTFISQVVIGKSDLSLDQAEKMNIFLKHDDEQSEFFIDLVIYERASDRDLKKRYKDKLDKKRVERLQIAKRIGQSNEISKENKRQFYSSHLYGLIHVLVSLPQFQSFDLLQKTLGISDKELHEKLKFMMRIGVIELKNNRYTPLENNIHLDKGSPEIIQHHTNWRIATIDKIKSTDKKDLHYSLTFSCSKKAANEIRESILKQLEKFSQTIVNSNPDNAYVYCFDFFKWD